MDKWIPATCVILTSALLLIGCSQAEEQAQAEDPETEPAWAETIPAAERRGVPEIQPREETTSPDILLEDVTYAWRVEPDRALSVTAVFRNPHDTYERARGYLFFVAEATSAAGTTVGVYPPHAVLKDGKPADFKEGAHLLFRTEEEVHATIPYREAAGFYDYLRIIVYSPEGEVMFDSGFPLEIGGDATGDLKPGMVGTL